MIHTYLTKQGLEATKPFDMVGDPPPWWPPARLWVAPPGGRLPLLAGCLPAVAAPDLSLPIQSRRVPLSALA